MRSVVVAVLWLTLEASAVGAPPSATPRTVLALYDGKSETNIRHSLIHARLELPLNHLGLIVRYHDVRAGLPDAAALETVRGVVSWFHGPPTDNVAEYLAWAIDLIDSGKKFVVIAELGVTPKEGSVTPEEVDEFWRRLGLRSDGSWVRMTYDLRILQQDPDVIGFERALLGVLPGYPIMRPEGGETRAFLTVRREGGLDTESVLVATGPGGGYIAPGYATYAPDENTRQWHLNPFEFFRHAFETDDLPKPDTTTISGRRIFYSHIDGDGWRNVSLVPGYRKQEALSAEVILEEILRPFPGLPVSVAPVVGDLDPEWSGDAVTLRLARQILALAHVEAGSHTYSHPLDWGYFDVSVEENERRHRRLLERADRSDWKRSPWLGPVQQWLGGDGDDPVPDGWSSEDGTYDRPRSYQHEAFDLDKEIQGSVAFLEELLPPGKRVELVQWSGNTTPFESALAAVRTLGLRNINGGDSRMDVEFPSYAWVAPLGVHVGDELQVYASNSNENTYTELWTDRFFGFQHLRATIQNTEHPIRVKPFNIYYHMYSGERLASLNAVTANLELAQQSELAPITTSRYAAVVDGFFEADIVRLSGTRWEIRDRDGIETIRFDHATARAVDWARSSGVLGQRYHQGSLYVSLDGCDPAPIVALTDSASPGSTPRASVPYFIHGRWRVSCLERHRDRFSFEIAGFGAGNMTWFVPSPGVYEVSETRGGRQETRRVLSDGNRLQITRDRAAIDPIFINVRSIGEESAP